MLEVFFLKQERNKYKTSHCKSYIYKCNWTKFRCGNFYKHKSAAPDCSKDSNKNPVFIFHDKLKKAPLKKRAKSEYNQTKSESNFCQKAVPPIPELNIILIGPPPCEGNIKYYKAAPILTAT